MTSKIQTQDNNLMWDHWGSDEGEVRLDVAPEEEQDDMALIPTDHTLNLYLKEVSRVPLLTKEEERELAARHRAGRDAELRLQEQPEELDAQERERLQTVVEDGLVARQRLIRANNPLYMPADSVAKYQANDRLRILDTKTESL